MLFVAVHCRVAATRRRLRCVRAGGAVPFGHRRVPCPFPYIHRHTGGRDTCFAACLPGFPLCVLDVAMHTYWLLIYLIISSCDFLTDTPPLCSTCRADRPYRIDASGTHVLVPRGARACWAPFIPTLRCSTLRAQLHHMQGACFAHRQSCPLVTSHFTFICVVAAPLS